MPAAPHAEHGRAPPHHQPVLAHPGAYQSAPPVPGAAAGVPGAHGASATQPQATAAAAAPQGPVPGATAGASGGAGGDIAPDSMGMPVGGRRVVYAGGDNPRAGGAVEVASITVYKTPPGFHAGRLVAASHDRRIVCYAMKNALIRATSHDAGLRGLLRGHETAVLDMTFLAPRRDLVDAGTYRFVSCGAGGKLFVWNICENAASASLQAVPVLHVQPTADGSVSPGGAAAAGAFVRCVAHPTDAGVLAAVAGREAFIVDVDDVLSGRTGTSGGPVVLRSGELRRRCRGHAGAIADARFSRDGKYLLTAGNDPYVMAWTVDTAAAVARWAPFGEGVGSVSAVVPLATADASGTVVCATATHGNALIKLWAVDVNSGHGPTAELQEIELRPPNDNAQWTLEASSSSRGPLLLAADTASCTLVVMWLSPTATWQVRYITDFALGFPVVSMSCLEDTSEGATALYAVQTAAVQRYWVQHACVTPGAGEEWVPPAEAPAAPAVPSRSAPPPVAKESDADGAELMSPQGLGASLPLEAAASAGSDSALLMPTSLDTARSESDGTGAGLRPAGSVSGTESGGPPNPEDLPGPVLAGFSGAAAAGASDNDSSTNPDADSPSPVTGDGRHGSAPGSDASSGSADSEVSDESRDDSPAVGAATVASGSDIAAVGSVRSADVPLPVRDVPVPIAEGAPEGSAGWGSGGASSAQLLSAVRDLINASNARLLASLEQAAMEREEAERKRQEMLLGAITHSLTEALPKVLAEEVAASPTVSAAIGSAVQSAVGGRLADNVGAAVRDALGEGLSAPLQSSVRDAVTAAVGSHVGAAAREAVAAALPEVVRSGVAEGVRSTAAAAVRAPVEAALRAAFSESLLPGFAAATQRMFEQIDEAGAARAADARRAEAAAAQSLQSAAREVGAAADAVRHVADAASSPATAPASHVPGPVPARSGAGAGGSTASPEQRAKLLALLRTGNAANVRAGFTDALNANDAQLVTWLCGMTSAQRPHVVAMLDQRLLMCLVQQLAHDVPAAAADGKALRAKIEWLQDCCAALLSRHDEVVVQLPRVLRAAASTLHTHTALFTAAEDVRTKHAATLAVIASLLASLPAPSA